MVRGMGGLVEKCSQAQHERNVAVKSMNRRSLFKLFALHLAAFVCVTPKSVKTPMALRHSGAGFIPSEATYILERGERALTEDQDKDSKKFTLMHPNA